MRYATLIIFGLSACAAIDPITAMRLAAADPLNADPADFAVQVDLPPGIGVVPGSAALALRVETELGIAVDGRYPLTRDHTGAWRLEGEALDGLRDDQATAIALETANPDNTSGSFSAGFEPCAIGDGPQPDVRTSVRLQFEPGGAYLPLIQNTLVRDLYGVETLSALAQCPTGAAE